MHALVILIVRQHLVRGSEYLKLLWSSMLWSSILWSSY